jgi:hypothetical protein
MLFPRLANHTTDDAPHNGRSFSTTTEHHQPAQSQEHANGQIHMRDGKEVELHTWDGPDDPDNPYGLLQPR